jgi:hypothetical protein
MAAPSTYQDPDTKRVSFFVNNRTWRILEKLAASRNMETWKFIKEHIEHLALASKTLVKSRMPEEHYTARHGTDVGDC